ncbi:beta-defensin 129 [Equus przewalskii]|uniref:Beta-defensin 129 n=1 Tax=Equus przewalskii TaxID=9798 RepID=A0ABM2F1J7_EQUPR|nr:beta-defensin 129 [Equus caballus]
MKLLFPIFASLVLQYQVNTEYFGLRRCLMGLGRCKDHCATNEREIQQCKNKRCCIGPKLVQVIKSYMKNELSHIFEENSQQLLKTTKSSSVVMQTKHHILSSLSKIKSTGSFAKINTITIPSAIPVNSTTINPKITGKITYTATSTKSDTKESKDSATDSPPTAPPP